MADDNFRDLTAIEEEESSELEPRFVPVARRNDRAQTLLNAAASQQPIRDLSRDPREVSVARIGRVLNAQLFGRERLGDIFHGCPVAVGAADFGEVDLAVLADDEC